MKLAAALVTVYLVWGSTYLAIAVADRTLPPLLMLSVRFLIAGALLYALVGAARRGRGERPGRRAVARGRGRRRGCCSSSTPAASPGRSSASLRDRGAPRRERPALHGAARPRLLRHPAAARRGRRASRSASLGVGAARRAGGQHRPARRRRAARRVVRLGGRLGLRPRRAAAARPAALAPRCRCCGRRAARRRRHRDGRARARASGAISAASLAAVAFLIVFGSLVAFTAYGWLLKNASTPLLSTYAYVNPAVAVFLGWAFVGEHVGGREIAAGLVILSSIGLLVFARAPREEPRADPRVAPRYIRRQDAQAGVREVPRLAGARGIVA